MSYTLAFAQRLGRILEKVTKQDDRLVAQRDHSPMWWWISSGSPSQRRARIRATLILFILFINSIAVSISTWLTVVVMAEPSMVRDVPTWLSFGVMPGIILFGLAFGIWWICTRTLSHLDWAIDSKMPTTSDQRNTFLIPWRIAKLHLLLWGGGAVVLSGLYGVYNLDFVPRIGLTVGFGGVVMATCVYLFAEFALRPAAARALVAGRPPQRMTPGVMGRTMTVWLVGSGVPILGIQLVAVFAILLKNLTQTELAVAVLITGSVAMVFGFLLMLIQSWFTATPIRMVCTALQRVEEGELPRPISVFDGTELGELQRGFNTMVDGLREREHVRDLFSRHVGPDVATAAEGQQNLRLGGEERYVAVLFVDIIGSTNLISVRPPMEVVDLLNRFFSIVVDEVERQGGHTNKFEGDASLAIFGAPTSMDSPEDAVLAAARAIIDRAPREVPECPVRIGIASGLAVAGNVGAASRFEYTVIGLPVHEAARLSDEARDKPGRVLATAVTVAAASESERRYWEIGDYLTLRGRPVATRIAQLAPMVRADATATEQQTSELAAQPN